MPAETVDTLELQIRTRAEQAAEQVEKLATSVADFGKNVRRYINNLNDFSTALTSIADAANKLSNTKGLAKVLNKVAPVAAAMKAKMPTTVTKQVDWRRQMFPNEKDYNAIFQPRGYNKGKAPGKIIRVGNNSAYVMDPEDVSKSGVRGLSKQIYKNYGLLRGAIPMSDMDARIAKIRTGYGRTTGANNAWMTENAFKEMQELARDILRASEPNHDNDVISHIKALGGVLRFDKDTDMTDQKIGDLNREFSGLGIKFSKSKGISVEDIRGLRNVEDLFGGINPEAAAARSLGLKDGDTLNDLIGMMRDARERKEYSLDSIIKDLMSNIADINVKNEREMADQGATAAQAAMKEAFEASQKAAEPEVKQEAEQAATEIKEAVNEAVKAEADAATSALKGKSNEPEYASIREAARIADEQAPRDRLEFALSDNTPGLIAANRSRFASAGLLDRWNEVFGKNIPGLADRGLAAGLIDAETAQAMKDAAAGVEQVSEAAKEAAENMEDLEDAAKDAGHECKSLKDILKAAGSAFGNSGVGKLLGQFGRILKMRFLRDLAKNLFGDINEGISNLYGWSDKIGGHFAGAMDTIASKAMLAKNSIATAFAPAIEALVPVLSTVVSWIHAASNALAQFIALITGQNSWTEAVETAEDWGGAVKGAGGAAKSAAKEVKDLLADWDELNIIQSKSGDGSGGGGGGGGKAAVDYAKMFKENMKFDEWTKYFEQIKKIVTAIGVGIAAWKLIDIGSSFLKSIGLAAADVDSVSSILKEGLVGAVLLTISFALAEATGKSIALNGITLANIATGVGSLLSGGIGGFLVGSAAARALAMAGIAAPGLGVIGAITGLSVAVILGVKAYFDQKNQTAYETAEEWVKKEAFDFDIDAKLNLVNATIGNVRAARANLKENATSLLGTIDAVKLGINNAETLALLKTQLGDANTGLIYSLNEYANEANNVLRLRYTMVPEKDDKGNDVSAESYMEKAGLVTGMSEWFTKKGEELGQYFVDGESGKIKEGYEQVAADIIEQIEKATAAVTQARINSELMVDLNATIASDAAEKIPQVMKDLEERARESAEEQYKEELQQAQDVYNFYKATEGLEGENFLKAKEWLDDLLKPETKSNFIDSYVSNLMGDANDKVTQYYKDKFIQPLMDQWLNSNFTGGRWSQREIDENFDSEHTVDDALNLWLSNMIDSVPGYIGLWLQEHGDLKPEDFLTDEQKQVIEDIRNRTRSHELPENGSEKGGLGAAESEIKEEITDSAGTVAENTLAVEELTDALEEFAPVKEPEAEEPVAKELSETEKLLAEYFKEVQEYYRSGGTNVNGLFEAEDKLQFLFADKPEMVASIVDAVWDYAEAQTDKKWLESPDVPSDLTSLLTTGINVDAATSGMALDSTMENVGNALTKNGDETNSLLDKVATRIADLLTATNNLADRPVQVNLGVSSLLGDLFGRSSDAYGKATG